MKEIIDYINTITSLNNATSGLNTTLNVTLDDVQSLDAHIIKLNADLGRLNVKSNIEGRIATDIIRAKNEASITEAFEGKGKFPETATSLSKIADGGLKLYETFEKLPPILEKVKAGVGTFKGTMEVLGGVEVLADTSGFADATEAISTILLGVDGIASACIGLGPIGWIAGAEALVVGGLTALTISENNKMQNERIPAFFEEAVKNSNPYVLEMGHIGTAAEGYINQTETLAEKSADEVAREVQKMKNKFLKQAIINFDYERAQGKDPVYLKALVDALNENDHSTTKSIAQVLFDDENDLDVFKKRFDIFEHFPLKEKDRIPKVTMYYEPGMGMRWRERGLAPQEVAINVSPVQLRDRASFVDKVAAALAWHALPPQCLVLEITESAAIEHNESISGCLADLRELGVTLAIDDFGTGYANLSNLTRFAFKKLKIDRSLLPQSRDERSRKLFANVVAMARELGLTVVAEGVETPNELATVAAARCAVVQGYFYSPPVTPEKLDALLSARFPEA